MTRVRDSLISEYGEEPVGAVNTKNDTPLLCDAIAQKQFSSASLLLENAQRYKKFVDLENGVCKTLDWALRKRVERVARFVLDDLTEQKLPMEECSCILANYVFRLTTACPGLVRQYLKNDMFTFEYGRFSVSRSLIDKNGKRAIAMTTDQPLERFRGHIAELAREFWMDHCDEHSKDLEESTGFQVEMAAKFFCVADSTVLTKRSNKERLCVFLYRQDYPVEVFESETLENLVDWWFYNYRHIYYFFTILDGITTLIFTIFSQVYGHGDKVGKTYRPLALGLSLSAMVLRCGSFLFYWSYAR